MRVFRRRASSDTDRPAVRWLSVNNRASVPTAFRASTRIPPTPITKPSTVLASLLEMRSLIFLIFPLSGALTERETDESFGEKRRPGFLHEDLTRHRRRGLSRYQRGSLRRNRSWCHGSR
jgi:hypothetical protein